MGGAGSIFLGVKHASIWAAVGAEAPATSPAGLRPESFSLEPARHIPMIIVQGDMDTLVPVAGARLWIEKVGCDLRPDYDRARLAGSSDAIGELLRLIDRAAADEDELTRIGRRALEDLHARLPAELKSGPDPLRLLEPDVLRALLPEAEATLIARLLDGSVPA